MHAGVRAWHPPWSSHHACLGSLRTASRIVHLAYGFTLANCHYGMFSLLPVPLPALGAPGVESAAVFGRGASGLTPLLSVSAHLSGPILAPLSVKCTTVHTSGCVATGLGVRAATRPASTGRPFASLHQRHHPHCDCPLHMLSCVKFLSVWRAARLSHDTRALSVAHRDDCARPTWTARLRVFQAPPPLIAHVRCAHLPVARDYCLSVHGCAEVAGENA